MSKLWKSDSKGSYLELSEIHTFHLKKIIQTLDQRYEELLAKLRPWPEQYAEVSRMGPAYLTQNLEGSEWATYHDLQRELTGRQHAAEEIFRENQQDRRSGSNDPS